MKRIILKYWTIELLTGFVLYVAYRITIMDTTAADDGLLATIADILDIVLNLAFSLLYLAAILLCSFTVFLNFLRRIRENYLLSWLSFSGAPILLIAFLIISLLINSHHFTGSVMTNLLIFSLLYTCITTILFIQFRKKYTAQNHSAKTSF